MSKHNYTQYSNNKKSDRNHNDSSIAPVSKSKTNYNNPNVEVTEEVKMVVDQAETEVVKPVIMHETVETVTLPKAVTGVIVNCNKLNIRTKPSVDADVVTILNSKSEIVIDTARSNDNWLKITTAAGVEGFCMRQFVDIKA